MKRETLLLTGATGFIGKHVLCALESKSFKKKYKVVSFVRRPIASPFVLGSLEDKQALLKATKGIDCIIHLAGETRSSKKHLNHTANVVGTRNIIEACKENNVKQLIYSGTVNTYLEKTGVYGESKKEAEAMVRKSGLDYVILKFNMVYGAGDDNLSKTVRLAKKLPIIPIIGNGESRVQPVYVDDVVGIILKCVELKKPKNKVYNLAGPRSITFNEYMAIVLNALHLKRMKLHIPPFFMKFFVIVTGNVFNKVINFELIHSLTQDKSMDISAAQQDLGFKPRAFEKMIHSQLS